MHSTATNLPMMLALAESGAEIVWGACNVDSTDDAVAAYLAERRITIYGWHGMTQADYDEHMQLVRAFDGDYLCDMGGELSLAAATDGQSPARRKMAGGGLGHPPPASQDPTVPERP